MKQSIAFCFLGLSLVNALNMMSMIDGVDLKFNSFIEIQNMNDATLKYVDERADIHQILTVDIVRSFKTNLFVDNYQFKSRIRYYLL